MIQRYGIPTGFACLLGLAACAAPDRRQADIQAVKNVEMARAKAAALKNPEKFASHYAPDAVALFPNTAAVTGRDDIQGAVTTMMRDPNFALSFEGTQAVASTGGDMVYTVGKYSLTLSDPKDNKPVVEKGKHMTVYKRQADGTWKAEADSINSDQPVPGIAH
jgi:uncharacterized protein (TIGR02246 family)